MKYKIGVFGSAVDDKEQVMQKAHELGEALAQENIIIVTGGCSGLPYVVASEAAKKGGEVWGYSPACDLQEHKTLYPKDDSSIYKQLLFVPKSFELHEQEIVKRKYRNVISTANCDAGIIIAGRWGTMNEFTNLYDFGKVIGVLTGTGGVADEIQYLMGKISKESKAKLIYSHDPQVLVQSILAQL